MVLRVQNVTRRLFTLSAAGLMLLVTACSSGSTPSSGGDASSAGSSSGVNSESASSIGAYQPDPNMDLNFLSTLREAEGADSGDRGTIHYVRFNAFSAALGNEKNTYDGEKFMVSLQGLVNREKPTLFVGDGVSENWFTYFRYQPEGLLYGYKQNVIRDMDTLIEIFRSEITGFGLVVWDPLQPFTSNIASTVCGVEGYLPVMYSTDPASLYVKLTKTHGIAVKMDLRGRFTGKSGTKIWDTSVDSTGSAKCDAYLWALEKYLKTGKCSTEYIAYMRDAWPVNHDFDNPQYIWESIYETYLPDQDFFVMKKAFFVDLDPFPDDIPNDDPTQSRGTDYQTLCKIFEQQYQNNNGKFSQMTGFTPFVHKYTDAVGGRYDAVMSEFQIVEVASAHNISVQADCPGPSSVHNCSVFTYAKSDKTYSQEDKRPTSLPEFDPTKKYITIYFGDYDAASWMAHIGTDRWQDEKRGTIPLGWAFNPNLYERVPMIFDWVHATATANDIFVAGDSGAGYVNPSLFEGGKRKHSSLPDGLEAWKAFCTPFYKKFDLSMTPFIMVGNTGFPSDRVLQAYATFSPDGCGVWSYPGGYFGDKVVDGMTVTGMPNDYTLNPHDTVENNVNQLLTIVGKRYTSLPFYQIKTNITKPSHMAEVLEKAQQQNENIVVLDYYTFFGMLKRQLGQ